MICTSFCAHKLKFFYTPEALNNNIEFYYSLATLDILIMLFLHREIECSSPKSASERALLRLFLKTKIMENIKLKKIYIIYNKRAPLSEILLYFCSMLL